MMRFFKFFISWQFWLSLILMGGIAYGVYYYVFNQWLFDHTRHGKQIRVPDLADLSIDEAMHKLDSLGLTYEIDSIKFDSVRAPKSVISYYPEAGFAVKEGRRVFIKSNPSTWLPVALPDLIDKSKRLAFTQLSITGLSVGDTLYAPDIAKDVVLRVLYEGREIKTGTKLPRFSKVDLVLGRGLLRDVQVPSFVGMNVEQATRLLRQNYFEVKAVNYYGAIKDSLRARVFFQNPPEGDLYDQGSEIELWATDSLLSDIQNKISMLNLEYKNIFESDSLEMEKQFEARQRGSLEGLSPEMRKQLEESEDVRRERRELQKARAQRKVQAKPKGNSTPKPTSKPKPKQSAPKPAPKPQAEPKNDGLIIPDIE